MQVAIHALFMVLYPEIVMTRRTGKKKRKTGWRRIT
jgi:hypothetical protein